jgi:transcriptional regulator with XRE-family HTH domain
VRTRPKKTQTLKLGAKFFGRTIRAFRLSLGISQEELAEKAGVSGSLVGMVEREKCRLSEQTLCSICLALESEAGRPMLRAVFDGVMVALWEELRSVELQMRKERGLALPLSIDEDNSAEEEFRRHLETYLTAEKSLATLVFRLGLGVTPIPRRVDVPVPMVESRKARVHRKPRTERTPANPGRKRQGPTSE